MVTDHKIQAILGSKPLQQREHTLHGSCFIGYKEKDFLFYRAKERGSHDTFFKTCMQIFSYKQCDNFSSFINIQFKPTNSNQLKKVRIENNDKIFLAV